MAKRNQMIDEVVVDNPPARLGSWGNRGPGRATNVNARQALFQVTVRLRTRPPGEAVAYLNEVLRIDSDRADVIGAAASVPEAATSAATLRPIDGWPPKVVSVPPLPVGPPCYHQAIESAMENARFQYEDIDGDMVITQSPLTVAIRRGWITCPWPLPQATTTA